MENQRIVPNHTMTKLKSEFLSLYVLDVINIFLLFLFVRCYGDPISTLTYVLTWPHNCKLTFGILNQHS